MRRRGTAMETVPDFTSDRMRMLGPLVTPRALELARHRLIHDRERLSDAADDDATVRIALILLREMNPVAQLTNEEEGILRGMDRKTFGKRRAAREV
jgi:hypothetical protein